MKLKILFFFGSLWITGWYDPAKVMSRIAEKLVPVLEKDEAFKIVDVSRRQTF